MHEAGKGMYVAESIDLAWQEGDIRVESLCWFELEAIRHAVHKHFAGSEPWGRLLEGPLVRRLADAARQGVTPAAADCRAFVAAIAPKLHDSCARPLLCRFRETKLPWHETSQRAESIRSWHEKDEYILFILPTGAVVFAREVAAPQPDVVNCVALTAFFPRQACWVVPKRGAQASVARYVQRWALQLHHSGGRLMPAFLDVVPGISETTGAAALQGRIRFISPETWGFKRLADDEWAWP